MLYLCCLAASPMLSPCGFTIVLLPVYPVSRFRQQRCSVCRRFVTSLCFVLRMRACCCCRCLVISLVLLFVALYYAPRAAPRLHLGAQRVNKWPYLMAPLPPPAYTLYTGVKLSLRTQRIDLSIYLQSRFCRMKGGCTPEMMRHMPGAA